MISIMGEDIVSSSWKHGAVVLNNGYTLTLCTEGKVKHTVGFSYNEVSRRYVTDEPAFYDPPFFRKAAPNVKQGSLAEPVASQSYPKRIYDNLMLEANYVYQELLKAGVAPEQARMVLPQSMYTSYYVTGSLAAFARAYNLRSDPTAQREIRELALQWNDICGSLYPVSWYHLTQSVKGQENNG